MRLGERHGNKPMLIRRLYHYENHEITLENASIRENGCFTHKNTHSRHGKKHTDHATQAWNRVMRLGERHPHKPMLIRQLYDQEKHETILENAPFWQNGCFTH